LRKHKLYINRITIHVPSDDVVLNDMFLFQVVLDNILAR
jgi:hypothetical protein